MCKSVFPCFLRNAWSDFCRQNFEMLSFASSIERTKTYVLNHKNKKVISGFVNFSKKKKCKKKITNPWITFDWECFRSSCFDTMCSLPGRAFKNFLLAKSSMLGRERSLLRTKKCEKKEFLIWTNPWITFSFVIRLTWKMLRCVSLTEESI